MALLLEGLLTDIGKCLTCSICFDIFTDPVTLTCGHSYCMKCLDDYLRGKANGKKECPQCRGKIKPGLKLPRNFTLYNIVNVHCDHKRFLSNEESTKGHEMEVDFKEDKAEECVASHSQETDINRPSELGSTIQQQQAEAPVVINDTSSEVTDDRCPDVPATHDGRFQELPISPPSNDRHRAEAGFAPPPHPLPGASFSWLTFNPALGHRRLTILPKEHRVVTKRASSACHDDRFDISQWMAEQEFSEGCHYWDVDTSASASWAVGVSYPSIGRRDHLGRTANSWCLEWSRDKLCYWHDNIEEFIKHGCPSIVRLALDVTNGTLSFYSLSDSQTLLHCVEEGFTEPVRPVFWLFGLKPNNALSFPPWAS
ncbi:E3 ubiquitin/ISG15 ligase TRIM25-like isoform X1 [Coregonus clupeaformis]|uniref:E3 ubiquitin/ISG15 ligase TRIM25-like isoform X1 n=1 Tax=Coregonus clupeaformis TaxID=59861 RepID=UPI001E1C64A6|nr:E3 ubiquitin/ISG15 ligase TRIM25-like isoform X1 [Coregonus clupeaformis]